jgi:ATP-binding cassette subfamily A (ABC1) protein 3
MFYLSRQFCPSVVRGFPSEAEFEEYILFDNMSQKVLAAIVFDCGFKNKSDPLPLQVRKFYFRFSNK